jgi:CheY-like chemotaxis protein
VSEPPADILLIEDNPSDIELMLYALKKHRMTERVQIVYDGAEAIEYLFCKRAFVHRNFLNMPKVAMVDLKLPKVGGLEVVRRVKTDPHIHSLPMVIFSSSREIEDITACYEAGANSYIVKPMEYDQFEEVIFRAVTYWTEIIQSGAPCRGFEGGHFHDGR